MNPWQWLLVAGTAGGGVAVLGALLPATRTAYVERLIDAPPVLVRETILDVEAQPAWRPAVAEVARRRANAGPTGNVGVAR